jgi:hypothetical protein
MAYALMQWHKQDALSVGVGFQMETLNWLAVNWADRIIVMTTDMVAEIPEVHRPNVAVCDVGPDIYGSPWNFVLIARCREFAGEWAKTKFALPSPRQVF